MNSDRLPFRARRSLLLISVMLSHIGQDAHCCCHCPAQKRQQRNDQIHGVTPSRGNRPPNDNSLVSYYMSMHGKCQYVPANILHLDQSLRLQSEDGSCKRGRGEGYCSHASRNVASLRPPSRNLILFCLRFRVKPGMTGGV